MPSLNHGWHQNYKDLDFQVGILSIVFVLFVTSDDMCNNLDEALGLTIVGNSRPSDHGDQQPRLRARC